MAVNDMNTAQVSQDISFHDVFEEFLAARVNLQLVLQAMRDTLAADATQAASIQQRIDQALQSGQLPEQSWERLTAEYDHLVAAEGPNAADWTDHGGEGPQFAGLDEDDAQPAAAPVEDRATGPASDDESGETGSAAVELEPGGLLNERYVLVSRVQHGAMGEVWKALDRQKKEAGADDPWVAVKVLGGELAQRPGAARALQNEAEICQRLDHPNVIQVFGFEQDKGVSFLTMEWLAGDSLQDLLDRARKKPPTAAQCDRILTGLFDALEHAHSRGVLHADVQPGNVMLSRDGTPKLVDFGIGRLADADVTDFDVSLLEARTPAYCSCEVLEGQPAEASDDVFSLALVVYRLLAGRPAFAQDTALAAEAEDQRPGRFGGITSGRWEALEKALAFRRSERTATVDEFREAFFAPEPEKQEETVVLQSAPAPQPVATPEEVPAEDEDTAINETLPPEAAQRPVWQRPPILGAAAGAVAIAIAVILFSGGEETPPAPVVASKPVPPAAAPAPDPAPELAEDLTPIEVTAEYRSGGTPSMLAAVDAADPSAAAVVDAAEDSSTASASAPTPEPEPVAKVAAEPAPTRAATAEAEPAAPVEPPKPAPRPEPEPAPRAAAPAPKPTPPAEPPKPEPVAARPAPEPAPPPSPPPPSRSEASQAAETTTVAMAPQTPPAPANTQVQPPPVEVEPAPPAGPTLVPLSQLEFREYVEAEYPPPLARKNISGWVELEFLVDTKGRTADIRVLASEPESMFDEAAIQAIEQWRFKPHETDGDRVAVLSQIRLRFEE